MRIKLQSFKVLKLYLSDEILTKFWQMIENSNNLEIYWTELKMEL